MKKKKEEIKAVIFDIGGVLAINKHALMKPFSGDHINHGVHDYIIRKLNINLDQWLDSMDTAYAKSIEGKITKVQVVKIIAKNVNKTPKQLEKIIVKAYKKNFKQNKELYRTAFKLKKQGYKIAILSDQWHLSKEGVMVPKYTKKFNKVVVSCDDGLRKPNPKIYKLMLKKLKLPAKETVFIDNQKWNIGPAQKLGMKTILFKDNKQCFAELKKFGILK